MTMSLAGWEDRLRIWFEISFNFILKWSLWSDGVVEWRFPVPQDRVRDAARGFGVSALIWWLKHERKSVF